jgi:PTS system galactitol-specific IIA component
MVDKGESVQVRLVFLLSLDQPKAQIEMLQEIAGVLQNSEVVSSLIEAKTYEDVCKSLSSI